MCARARSPHPTSVSSLSWQVVGVFAAHDHCSNYCCVSNSTYLCYGQHTTAGGYYCSATGEQFRFDDDLSLHPLEVAEAQDGSGFGMRLIEVTTQPDGRWQVATRIALTNGSIVLQADLGSSA